MGPIVKSVTAFLSVTLFSLSGFALYLLLRKKDDDHEFQDTFAHASKFKTTEIRVPKDMMRLMLRKNRECIKAIEERTSTRIRFRDGEDADHMICVIRGNADACFIAENQIQEFIEEQPVLETKTIRVPVGSVGMIIGRGGEKIAEIRMISGARINVVDENDSVTTKAITIKGTREQINLAISLIEPVVKQSAARQLATDVTMSRRQPRLPPRAVDRPPAERLSPSRCHQEMPFEVYMSSIDNPSRFWVQIIGPKMAELDSLVEEMTEYYERGDGTRVVAGKARCGDLVAAQFWIDNKWYRAEILNITEENSERKAKVYFVDYGDVATIPINSLYELRTDFLRLHFQAVECFLARVEPVGDSWSEQAIDRFEELTYMAQWKKLSARMNGYRVREQTASGREASTVPGVDLYQIEKGDVDIGAELVTAGLAVFSREALLADNSRTTSASNLSEAEAGASNLQADEPGASNLSAAEAGASNLQADEPGDSNLSESEAGASNLSTVEAEANNLQAAEAEANKLQADEDGASNLSESEAGASNPTESRASYLTEFEAFAINTSEIEVNVSSLSETGADVSSLSEDGVGVNIFIEAEADPVNLREAEAEPINPREAEAGPINLREAGAINLREAEAGASNLRVDEAGPSNLRTAEAGPSFLSEAGASNLSESEASASFLTEFDFFLESNNSETEVSLSTPSDTAAGVSSLSEDGVGVNMFIETGANPPQSRSWPEQSPRSRSWPAQHQRR